jgi:hypothetical protein
MAMADIGPREEGYNEPKQHYNNIVIVFPKLSKECSTTLSMIAIMKVKSQVLFHQIDRYE